MKAFSITPTLLCALLVFVPYPSTALPRNETLEGIEIVKKMRTPITKDDSASSEDTSAGQNEYGEMFLLDSASMRYEIIEETTMRDMSGNTIVVDQLKTPCTADLVIQKLDSGYSNTLEIKIKSCSSNASNKWFEVNGE